MRSLILAAAMANVINPPVSLSDWELRDYVVSQPIADDIGVYDPFQPQISTNTVLNTGVGKFGGRCIRVNANSLFRMAGNPFRLYGDFTIEGFFNFETLVAGSNQYFLDFGSNGFTLRYYSSYGISVTTGDNPLIQTGFVPNQNQWYHIAVVRQNGLLKLYIDGVMAGQAVYTVNLAHSTATLANYGGGSGYSPVGRIDQFRITLAAVYTENFTPPTEPFKITTYEPNYDPLWSKVKLLTKASGGVAANKGSAGGTFVADGGATIAEGAGVFGGDCMHFPVDGARWTMPYDPTNHFGFDSEDWTVECYVKPTRTVSRDQVLVGRRAAGRAGGFLLSLSNMAPVIYVSSSSSTWAATGNVTGTALTLNRWYHISATRFGSTIMLFINGKLVDSKTFTPTINVSTLPLSIGASSDGTESFQGYIDRARVTRGTARYTSNFITRKVNDFAETDVITPVSPVNDPYWANVPMMLPFDRSIDTGPDQMSIVLQRTGAQLDNTRPLFGKPTLKIDTGSTGGINYSNGSEALLGTFPATVEGWINTDFTLSNGLPMIGQYHGTSNGAWLLGVANGKARFYVRNPNNVLIDGTSNIADGQWHHIAVTMANGMGQIWVDGVLEGSGPITNQYPTYGGNIQVGYNIAAEVPDGYRINVTRVKVTQGVVRYTSNFVPGENTIQLTGMTA